MMVDPSNDGNDLGSTGLNNSLIPVGLVGEPTLTMSTYVNDPDWSAATIYFYGLWPYREGLFNLPVSSFSIGRQDRHLGHWQLSESL